jgi:hypothetical protein
MHAARTTPDVRRANAAHRSRGAGYRLAACVSAALLALAIAGEAGAASLCGMSPRDWCQAPDGDICNAHRDAASCRADMRCTAMRYRGESVVACIYDARGFPTNCPVVGCISVGKRAKP